MENNLSDSTSVENVIQSLIIAEEYGEDYEAYFKNYSYEGIKVFEPRAYNQSDYSKQLFNIMDTIVGLFKDGDKYYLKECLITKTNVFEGDCVGVALVEPTLNTNSRCLFLFRGLEKYNKGKFTNLLTASKKIWTDKSEMFDFNNVVYTLISEGDVVAEHDDDSDSYYEDIVNYKLCLSDDKKSQYIVKVKEQRGVMTEICFAGDLDGDGKPDLIVQSPSFDKEYRLLLFLSSYAEGDELVKLVSILVDSFDC